MNSSFYYHFELLPRVWSICKMRKRENGQERSYSCVCCMKNHKYEKCLIKSRLQYLTSCNINSTSTSNVNETAAWEAPPPLSLSLSLSLSVGCNVHLRGKLSLSKTKTMMLVGGSITLENRWRSLLLLSQLIQATVDCHIREEGTKVANRPELLYTVELLIFALKYVHIGYVYIHILTGAYVCIIIRQILKCVSTLE